FYKSLPPFRADCNTNTYEAMQFIYPNETATIFLPKDLDGETNPLILKIAHTTPETTIYWYLNETYICATKDIHEIATSPQEGTHTVTAVDLFGNEIKRQLKITI